MNVVCRQLRLGPPKWIDSDVDWLGVPGNLKEYRWDNPRLTSNKRNLSYYKVMCTGKESSLADCDFKNCHYHNLYYTKPYIQSQCFTGQTKENLVELVRRNRYRDDEGTLVTFVKGTWGPICTRFQNLSRVFCPTIGQKEKFSNATKNVQTYIYDDPVAYVHKCKGNEHSISMCDMDTTVTANEDITCDRLSFAYVECKRVYPPLPPKPPEGPDHVLISILGVVLLLIMCTSAICYKKGTRVRRRFDDDEYDSQIRDPNMTADEARLRYIQSIF
ncbi:hypothetical protein HOLleu_27127 [Holothuria leucospilota]|uniref:SRCR domain-containing protein n=1 Tax=Holothuria leucospilota TaxID=206669 RepID=A0A9Q1H0L8_HOLLE|nr:hypothetical protein HOLleu_27127 [Holothuria leucospilota]